VLILSRSTDEAIDSSVHGLSREKPKYHRDKDLGQIVSYFIHIRIIVIIICSDVISGSSVFGGRDSRSSILTSHTYQVKILEHWHNFQEQVPQALSGSRPLRAATETYLASLVITIFGVWLIALFVEGRMSSVFVRYCPMPWLHSDLPFVLDLDQPLCFSGGPYDQKSERIVREETKEAMNRYKQSEKF
jgi:hypothetical protein